MNSQLRSWVGSLVVIGLLAAALGWWVLNTIKAPVSVAPLPAGKTDSPLASPVIQRLKDRVIYGAIPVADPGPSKRADPFVK